MNEVKLFICFIALYEDSCMNFCFVMILLFFTKFIMPINLQQSFDINSYRSRAPPNHPNPSEQSICATTAIMSSPTPFVKGCNILAQVRRLHFDIVFKTKDHRIPTHAYYDLGQIWSALRTALGDIRDIADKATAAKTQQYERYLIETRRWNDTKKLRAAQADLCLQQFKHVNTTLSNKVRTRGQNTEYELTCMRNLVDNYEDALGPTAHLVHSNSMRRPRPDYEIYRPNEVFLDSLSRRLENITRRRPIEMLQSRWIKNRASVVLREKSKRFHLLCKRVEARKERADKARARYQDLQKRVDEYASLKKAVLNLQRAVCSTFQFESDEKDGDITATILRMEILSIEA